MNENTFDTSIDGASELTDAELMQVQGGGIGSWFKKAVRTVKHWAEDIIGTAQKPVPSPFNPYPPPPYL